MRCEGANLRWRDDGTSPTTSEGLLLRAGEVLCYCGDLQGFEAIRDDTNDATLYVAYYRSPELYLPAYEKGSWLKRAITLQSSTARTATGQTTGQTDFQDIARAAFYIDCTAVSGTSPTLDVTVQEFDALGSDWYTVGTFAQLTTTGNERIAVDPLHGDQIRIQYTITGTSPSFTFSVGAVGHRE